MEAQSAASEGTASWSRLPARITIIVFWGLVLAGTVISVFVLNGLEERLAHRYARHADSLAYRVTRMLADHEPLTAAALGAELAVEQERIRLSAIEVNLPGGTTISAGVTAPDQQAELRAIELPPDMARGADRTAWVCLFFPPLAELVADQRKHFLLAMGGALLAFGLVLAVVLQRMLSRPFLQMVGIAQAVTAGDPRARFDDARRDEFGYLGRFVNESLDRLRAHQTEIERALLELQSSEAALFQEKERAEVTLASIGDAVVTTDAQARIEYLNHAAEQLTGWTTADVRGRPLTEIAVLSDEQTRGPVANPVDACLAEGRPVSQQEHAMLRCRSGEERAVVATAAPIRDHDGRVLGAVLVLRDIAAMRKLTRQLSWQASHDSLTGLNNRREFERQLQLAVEEAREGSASHVLCYLDLDQFKVVNDTCGHAAGDELLRQIATRLQEQVRDSDVIARLGGDEFGVLLKGCSEEIAQRIAQKLLRAVKDHRFTWQGHSFDVGVSIGMVAIDAESGECTELLAHADVACYTAKDLGRNRAYFFQADDSQIRQRRGEMRWVPRLRRAIEEDRLRLYAQRIAPAAGPGERMPLCAEVLLRLVDEDGRVLSPGAFLPAAERYGFMPQLDRWVVRRVFEYLRNGANACTGGVYSINLSGQSLGDDAFLGFIIGEIDRSGVDPQRVCFEITETAAIADLSRATRCIQVLRGMGCRFALDDFGTGVSSFAYLKNLKVDYLKIAGHFVTRIVEDPLDRSIVASIHEIGHIVGLRTVAEFVENDEMFARLREIGVDYVQGYGVHMPQSLEEMDCPRANCRAAGGAG
jgi:diguanylate cyclase (GGDEF)-like protein/PAS domain S-box-containing protein